ncbi:hypothetical protein M9Y10_005373 [Tritrichomonas musculus]|uniref:MSP domain-containing protein n=1 Tax=Tritrichomonas musculus TaxID=1915356 RepID=A0ABR2JL05_9EUKA
MSLMSALDDNKDDENPLTSSNDSKPISSNDDEVFFNNISTSFQKQTFQTRSEYQYINTNILPNVTIFPTNIHFSTTYPNKSLQTKIIISNGGSQSEDFNISLKGDPEFSVSTQKISLAPGETQSFVINFNPKKVSLFNSSLIFEGRTSIVAPITGHCIPSPLEYPLINSPSWIFPKKKTSKLISFSNNSLSESLSVVISTNCMAFKVSPQAFDIPPSSSCDINISFDPNQQLTENPSISIQCSQSGDSVTIPLVVAPNKEKIIVDFGSISVGRNTKQILSLKCPQLAPIVQWPFALDNISDNGLPQDKLVFTFTAREVGDFRSRVHLSNFELELKASSVDPPYRIKIPSHFPLHPLKIQNISESMLNLAFSLNTSAFMIDPETADLRPNQVSEFSIKSSNANVSIPDQIIMKVIWSTTEGKRVVDEYQLPVNLNQSLSAIDIENDDSSFSYSQRKRSSSKCRTEVNPNDIETITNASNYDSEATTNSKKSSIYDNQIMKTSHKIKRRSNKNSQASFNYYDRNESNNQTQNRDDAEIDDVDYYSPPPNFEKQSQLNSSRYDSSIKETSDSKRIQNSSQMPRRNHIVETDSFDYYEEEILDSPDQTDKQTKTTNQGYDQHSKYSLSLNSYEEHQINNNSYGYDDDHALSNEYPGFYSEYDLDQNEDDIHRTNDKRNINQKVSQTIDFRYSKKAIKKSQYEDNQAHQQYRHHHHRHHHHNHENNEYKSQSNNRSRSIHENQREEGNKFKSHKPKRSPHNTNRRTSNIKEYNSDYDYYDDEYYELSDFPKDKKTLRETQRNRKAIHRSKYYPDSASSQVRRKKHKIPNKNINYYPNNNSDIEFEEEEEDANFASEERPQPSKKKKTLLESSDYSSEGEMNKDDQSKGPGKKNTTTSSFIRADDLKTQMTQTNTIGNGLQNLGSQTLDSFDEELESHSANTSKIQSTKNPTSSTSTMATSTITTDNEENSMNKSQNRSDLDTQTQNSKTVSFSSGLTQISQKQNSRPIVPTTASFSIVPFFAVSPRHPARFELTINSDYDIEIETPQWIQLPHSINPNQTISMQVSTLPKETVASTFSVHSESGDLSLPIIAYRGSSNLIFDSEIEMIEITDDQFTAAMIVKNKGQRAGFIAFMLSESSSANFRVSPPVAIIQPNSNLQVKFLVTTKSSEFTIPIVAYYGDEIVRQMQSVVAPNDYMSTAFNEIELTNEISAFESIINECKARDILKIFRKASLSSKLVFKSPKKTFGLNRVTISPSSIDFLNENEERKVSVLNLSPEPLSFSVSSPSDYANFSPRMGAAPPYGEAVITVSLSNLYESKIVIQVGKEKFDVPLRIVNGLRNKKKLNSPLPNTNSIFSNDNDTYNNIVEQRKVRKIKKKSNDNEFQESSGAFSVIDNKIEFDIVNIGDSKTLQFIIVNNEMHNMNLYLSLDNSAFVCENQVLILANNESAVDITFKPKKAGIFEGNLFIQNNDHKIKIQLSGECANNISSASSFITHPLEFPPCVPATIRRAQLRVSNKTDRFVNITSHTSYPFHCPYPNFEVEPYSYVLVPVRFIPKQPGEYSGTIEFHSSNGTVSTVELSGICVDI